MNSKCSLWWLMTLKCEIKYWCCCFRSQLTPNDDELKLFFWEIGCHLFCTCHSGVIKIRRFSLVFREFLHRHFHEELRKWYRLFQFLLFKIIFFRVNWKYFWGHYQFFFLKVLTTHRIDEPLSGHRCDAVNWENFHTQKMLPSFWPNIFFAHVKLCYTRAVRGKGENMRNCQADVFFWRNQFSSLFVYL